MECKSVIFPIMTIHFLHARCGALAVAALVFFSVLSFSAPVRAGAAAASDTSGIQGTSLRGSPVQLAPVVVTATRSENRANQVISDISVIDSQTIERSVGLSLSQLLARQSGIQFVSNGGSGSNSGIFIRGSKSAHVLLLADGVRIGSTPSGQSSWLALAVENFERIEILRGSASALYGSGAVGGVINLITRRGRRGQRFTPYAQATVGSGSSHEVAAGFSGSASDSLVQYALHVQTGGGSDFSARNGQIAALPFERGDGGFSRHSISGNLRWNFHPRWNVRAQLLHSDTDAEFDTDSAAVQAKRQAQGRVYSVSLHGQPTDIWHTSLQWASSYDESDNRASYGYSTFNIRGESWNWQNTIRTRVGEVLAGVERQQERVEPTARYTVTQRSVDSVYLGLNGRAGIHDWQLNWRRDDNPQFGGQSSFYLAYGLRPSPDWQTYISYGTSFQVPAFNRLNYPGYGNANLKPQKGKNWQLGAEYVLGNHSFGAVYYRNTIERLIKGKGQGQQAVNAGQAVRKGLELQYKGHFGPYAAYANLNIMDSAGKSAGGDRRPGGTLKNRMRLGVDYGSGNWTAGGSVLAVSDRLEYHYTAGTARQRGYALLNGYVGYRLQRDWQLQFTLNNMGDKRHGTAYGYSQTGRSACLTLRYSPR